MNMSTGVKKKIGILIEEHFDEIEFNRFIDYFPSMGYEIEFITRLWGNKTLTFKGVEHQAEVTVYKDVSDVDIGDYSGFILIGAYAMDRLRYEENPVKDQPNNSPAIRLIREIMSTQGKKLGTICHSLWMLTSAPDLLKGRSVTCAHNILYDVQNAGANVIFDGDKTTKYHVDGDLICGNHPNMVDEFMQLFINEIEKQGDTVAEPEKVAV
ncbi:ThiJ/PfpI family protein [hydrothermal vent metagenome]|uniref:ThiJ/PfpI family protein n=1 Tax=hydrothermal vent metagenome TaxID=652676 RepID=A0A3B0ZE71_9ZZZZ